MSSRNGGFRGKRRFNGHKRNYQRHEQKREYRHVEQLKEEEVGITEFLSDLEGFTGILKARYSDFQVNEIDLDGNVAKLTNTDIPKDFTVKTDYKTVTETPCELIPQETWDAIKSMIDKNEDKSDLKEIDVVNLPAEDITKDDRTKIHTAVKKIFGQKVIASTVTVDDKKMLQFKKQDNSRQDTRVQWPEDKGEFVHFIVYKEALDTMDITLKISDCLRISPANFNYAGVKDKRAKTTQWFSVKKVEPWKLIIKTKSLRNVKIGNITFKDQPLKLGHLSGNQFRIALRNITADDEIIDKGLEFVKENGFLNYYGLQRFGNDKEVPTYEIGVKLLQGEWKEACKLILKPKKSDDPNLDVSKAKNVYHETGNAENAYKELDRSKNRCVESRLLLGLSKGHENEYVNSLESIPRNTRLLYLHSFQSLIWNKMISIRIKEFGLKPIAGDFILLSDETIVNIDIPSETLICEEIKEKDDTENNKEDTEEKELKCKQEIKELTSDDLESYTIFDVVLPLPGYDVKYPKHMEKYYKEALEEYNLSLEMPKQNVKTYTLSGNYRKIMGQLKDLTWKTILYNDPNDNLILSDFEELRKMDEPKSVENGKFKALVMSFSLSSSSYATMALREIMKMDTSTSNHAKLNNYSETKEEKKIEQTGENSAKTEYKEIIQESSLLKDKEKYDEFKSNIFNAIGIPMKRKPEEVEIGEVKKSKLEEKEPESSIKMEASLV